MRVQPIKALVKSIPCLSLVDEKSKILKEINASDLGYNGILKQEIKPQSSVTILDSGIVLKRTILP